MRTREEGPCRELDDYLPSLQRLEETEYAMIPDRTLCVGVREITLYGERIEAGDDIYMGFKKSGIPCAAPRWHSQSLTC